MLVVTIYDDGGQQKFQVHTLDGEVTRDITEQYEVRQLAVDPEDDPDAVVAGWHIGKRLKTSEVLSDGE